MHLTNSQGHHAARLNRLIQVTLVAGLSVSMLLMVTGAVLYMLQAPAAGTCMVAGIVALMVTPAVRVLVAALGYVLDRDWTFALISLGVIAVLTVSVLIGKG